MNNTKEVQAMQLPIQKLRPFENHPFQVKDDDEMNQLVWSVLTQGVLTPLVVRPLENDEYEVISGHRRLHACQKAGIETVPALIYSMDRDAAVIALVDSNLHREHLLPSEKAFAYKMKMEAMNHRGKTCGQVGHKSRYSLSDDESGRQIQRYIRLTYLIPEILQMVDEKKIALSPAYQIAALPQESQNLLYDTIESEQATPSLSQAQRIRKLSQSGKLDEDSMLQIMMEQKKPERNDITLSGEKLRKYFPRSYSPQRIEETIFKLLDAWMRKRQRDNSR